MSVCSCEREELGSEHCVFVEEARGASEVERTASAVGEAPQGRVDGEAAVTARGFRGYFLGVRGDDQPRVGEVDVLGLDADGRILPLTPLSGYAGDCRGAVSSRERERLGLIFSEEESAEFKFKRPVG